MDYYRDDPLIQRLIGVHRLPSVSTISRALSQIDSEGVERVRELSFSLVIETRPAAMVCAVAEIPHEDWGEQVHAEIMLKDCTKTDDEEIKAFCKE